VSSSQNFLQARVADRHTPLIVTAHLKKSNDRAHAHPKRMVTEHTVANDRKSEEQVPYKDEK